MIGNKHLLLFVVFTLTILVNTVISQGPQSLSIAPSWPPWGGGNRRICGCFWRRRNSCGPWDPWCRQGQWGSGRRSCPWGWYESWRGGRQCSWQQVQCCRNGRGRRWD